MILEVLLAAAIQTAPPPVNPSRIGFTCPDHAQDDQHELDIVTEAGVVVSTILLGDPPLNSAGEVEATISVQPIKFGRYVFRVRAVAQGLESVDSLGSEVWVRAPGQPGKPVIK